MGLMRETEVCEDPGLNHTVAHVLSGGLILALVFMGIGAVLGILIPGSLEPNATPFVGMFSGLVQGSPMAYMSLGLICMLATPAARVAVLFLSYIRRKDWLFVAIAAAVFAVLAISVVIGWRR